ELAVVLGLAEGVGDGPVGEVEAAGGEFVVPDELPVAGGLCGCGGQEGDGKEDDGDAFHEMTSTGKQVSPWHPSMQVIKTENEGQTRMSTSPLAASGQAVQGERLGRSTQRLASSSSMNCHVAGSHLRGRFSQ